MTYLRVVYGWSVLDQRLGEAILASDRSPQAVAEVLRGQLEAFQRMDARDNYPNVPEWHSYLRRARNNCKDFFTIINDSRGNDA